LKGGLHDFTNGESPYERVIRLVGPALESFDDDKQIPTFRFGCSQTRDQSTLPLALSGVANCFGYQGVLDCYRASIPHLTFSGPTTMAPMIDEAIRTVQQTGEYHILLILTDGDMSSPRTDAAAVVRASNFPISIVVVGLGDGPFEVMEQFDDKLPERQFDNFQFVCLSEAEKAMAKSERPDLDLVTLLLAEIPDQYKAIKSLGLLDSVRRRY
ncbi:hypothetical protein KIPB_009910, partial [Kipferlia bialata]